MSLKISKLMGLAATIQSGFAGVDSRWLMFALRGTDTDATFLRELSRREKRPRKL